MRAYATDRRGPISSLSLRDLPKPAPGAGELLIKVRAAAPNPADLTVLSGKGAAPFLHDSRFPLVPGHDFSGVVEQLGAGVSNHAVGDEVFGFLPYSRRTHQGSFADYLTAHAGTLAKKPKGLSHEEAAGAATVALTALQSLRDKAHLQPGQSVLINGASGGVGSYAVQIAKLLGGKVSAIASGAREEAVRALGAEAFYDYKKTRLAARKGEPDALGEPFDVIFDAVSNSSFSACAPWLKPSGAYVTLLLSKDLLLGKLRSLLSSKGCHFVVVEPRPADLSQLASWFEEGKLKPVLERAYPLEELPAALERMKRGDVRGKLAITVAA